MKPLLSSTTQPLSQRVLGSAPVIKNTWATFFFSILPVCVFRHVTRSRWSTPSRPTTSACVSRLMLGACSIRRMRYFDIVSVRPELLIVLTETIPQEGIKGLSMNFCACSKACGVIRDLFLQVWPGERGTTAEAPFDLDNVKNAERQ